jgi:hypothetical protein
MSTSVRHVNFPLSLIPNACILTAIYKLRHTTHTLFTISTFHNARWATRAVNMLKQKIQRAKLCFCKHMTQEEGSSMNQRPATTLPHYENFISSLDLFCHHASAAVRGSPGDWHHCLGTASSLTSRPLVTSSIRSWQNGPRNQKEVLTAAM